GSSARSVSRSGGASGRRSKPTLPPPRSRSNRSSKGSSLPNGLKGSKGPRGARRPRRCGRCARCPSGSTRICTACAFWRRPPTSTLAGPMLYTPARVAVSCQVALIPVWRTMRKPVIETCCRVPTLGPRTSKPFGVTSSGLLGAWSSLLIASSCTSSVSPTLISWLLTCSWRSVWLSAAPGSPTSSASASSQPMSRGFIGPRSLVFYHPPDPATLSSSGLLLHGRRSFQLVQGFVILAQRKRVLLLGRGLPGRLLALGGLLWRRGFLVLALLLVRLFLILLVGGWVLLVLVLGWVRLLLVLILVLLPILILLLVLVAVGRFLARVAVLRRLIGGRSGIPLLVGAGIGRVRRRWLVLLGAPQSERAIVRRIAPNGQGRRRLVARDPLERAVVVRDGRLVLAAQELQIPEQIVRLGQELDGQVAARHDLLQHRQPAGHLRAARS